jgi:hypothetical protein
MIRCRTCAGRWSTAAGPCCADACNALLRIALPSGRYRVLYESPAERNPGSTTSTQDGSGQHVIVVSGSQAGWIRAGKLVLLRAPGSALQFSLGITTIAW